MNRRPQLRLIAPDASPEEAAAVVAALEQFMRDTAPVVVVDTEPATSRWLQAARQEAVLREPDLRPRWA